MHTMFKTTTACIVGLALAASALTASAQTKAKGKIASAVAGKLVKVTDGQVKSHELNANPKYYVIYHSASW